MEAQAIATGGGAIIAGIGSVQPIPALLRSSTTQQKQLSTTSSTTALSPLHCRKKAAEESGEGTISGSFVKNAGASQTSNFESVQFRNAETGQVVNSEDYTRVEITQAAIDAGSLTGTYDSTDIGSYEFTSDNSTTFKANQEVLQISDFKQTQDSKNDVTVKGINSENNIVADDAAEFTSTISKIDTTTAGTASGTASGSAGGTVSTTASASASSSSFINSFVQA